jgi:hypothetical protein
VFTIPIIDSIVKKNSTSVSIDVFVVVVFPDITRCKLLVWLGIQEKRKAKGKEE